MRLSCDKLRANSAFLGWWTHLVLRANRRWLSWAFADTTGPPSAIRVVEIAYGIAPYDQRQGLATLAAAELTRRAFRDERVSLVIAHTLCEPMRRLGCWRNWE